MVNDNIIKEYVKINDNERMNAIKMKEFQNDIAQRQVFLKDKNVCENAFVKKEKEKEKVEDGITNQIKLREKIVECGMVSKCNDSNNIQLFSFDNLILNLEWNILKHFVSNIITYGLHCGSSSLNGNTNVCMNNHNSIVTSVKRSTIGEQNRLVDIDSAVYTVSASGNNQCLFISLQHITIDSIYLTNTTSADALLMGGTNNFLSFDSFMSMVIGFDDYYEVNDILNSNISAAKNEVMTIYDLCKSDTNFYFRNVHLVGKSVQGLKQAQYTYKLYDDNG